MLACEAKRVSPAHVVVALHTSASRGRAVDILIFACLGIKDGGPRIIFVRIDVLHKERCVGGCVKSQQRQETLTILRLLFAGKSGASIVHEKLPVLRYFQSPFETCSLLY